MSAESAELPILPPLDARIPKWSLDRLDDRKCPVCRGHNHPWLKRPDLLPVAFCASCQLWYVAGLPPVEAIQKFYQGYWFSFRPKDLSPAYAARLMANTGFFDDDVRMNRLTALSGGLAGKRVLDIGCGCGEFLAGARHRGASVFGNDISQEACSFLKEQLNIPVFQGALSAAEFCAEFGQMDAVVMSDLIEHPVEPLHTIETALEVLKPGGLLLILTPNGGGAFDTLERALQWVGFRVDLEHLQYFSPATIAVLANRFGCRIEHLETLGYPGLKGIDVLPTTQVAAGSPGTSALRATLRKSTLARGLVQAARGFRSVTEEPEPDPRSGTYELIAVLRKAGQD